MMESPKNVSGFLGMTGHTVDGEKLQPHLYEKVRGLEQALRHLDFIIGDFRDKIEHIEKANVRDHIILVDLIKRVEKLEEVNEQCFKANPIAQIEERFKKIEAEFPKIKEAFGFVKFKKPHKCPLCEGEGYKRWSTENMAGGGRCSTCEGIGIVWG